jgi:solute carrier family 6 amino acid transporter-like protein 5/7/9/14
MLLIVIGIGLYYNVIIAWIIYYLIAVLASLPSGELPWTSCGNRCCLSPSTSLPSLSSSTSLSPSTSLPSSWNTPDCLDIHSEEGNRTASGNATTAPEEFFTRKMLQLSPGIEQMGGLRLELAGCLVLAWTLVFLALIKGVKSLGKAVYFTAIFPYLILTVLLGFGLSLDGALDGIRYYVTPRLDRLLDVQVGSTPPQVPHATQVWADAAMQIFFSLGPCWGSLITLASYNKFNNNTLR